MNTRLLISSLLLGFAVVAPLRAANPSDLVGPEKRRTTVELALALTRPPVAVTLPVDLPLPFNPPNFDQTDAEERALAARSAMLSAPEQPTGDRAILDLLATKIVPTGSLFVGGEPRLIFSKKTVKIGTRFTVTYKEHDYELELVAIERTTFTLRLNREEITRPIKTGKSP